MEEPQLSSGPASGVAVLSLPEGESTANDGLRVEGMTSKLSVQGLLAASERELGRFDWEGTFADYLTMVCRTPSLSRLSHAYVHDAILEAGVEETTSGERSYGIFKDEIYGLEFHLERIVRYFASAAQRLEVRKRILLLLGPPASGKSSIIELIKRVLEQYTRTDAGAVYAIAACPMQEEPLHLIPAQLRSRLLNDYGVYVEGDLCPRCRYVLRSEHRGKVSEMPVKRVLFSEQEAVGLGYYVATNPNPSDASLLVGSVDDGQLDGDRTEVAGRAFRLDGEFNVANRGLMEFVEIFKADRHILTTLLGLAQEQVIKMEKFGSVYADETVIGHSNEGDFTTFAAEEHSEALKDRIIAIRVPYNLKTSEEVKIYRKMLRRSSVADIHVAPLALPVVSSFAVLSRLDLPTKQGMSLVQKLRLYDGQMDGSYTHQDVVEMKRHSPTEGMEGVSPRYVMNRLAAVASGEDISCLAPLAALDSLWRGMKENISLDDSDLIKFVGLVSDSVKEYGTLALRDVQRAYDESFEQSAAMSLKNYLENVVAFNKSNKSKTARTNKEQAAVERDMRDLERLVGVSEREKVQFRTEIDGLFSTWKKKKLPFDYATEPRLKTAIESRLFPNPRNLERELREPRFARRKVEWTRRRASIVKRLIDNHDYCELCADDLMDYVLHVLGSKQVVKTPKNEGVDWLWPLDPADKAGRPG